MRRKAIHILNVYLNRLRGDGRFESISDARMFIEMKILFRKLVGDFFLISMGIISAGFGLRGFLLPNNFLDGGATGISLLISELTGINLSLLLLVVNIPFIVLGY